MSSFSDLDSEKIRELKEEHDDLVEQNRLLEIKFEQGVKTLLDGEAELAALRKQEEVYLKQEEAYLKREEVYLKRIQELEEKVDIPQAIEDLKYMKEQFYDVLLFIRAERAENARCTADNTRSAEFLASMTDQAEDRAAKRQRESE